MYRRRNYLIIDFKPVKTERSIEKMFKIIFFLHPMMKFSTWRSFAATHLCQTTVSFHHDIKSLHITIICILILRCFLRFWNWKWSQTARYAMQIFLRKFLLDLTINHPHCSPINISFLTSLYHWVSNNVHKNWMIYQENFLMSFLFCAHFYKH